MNPSAQPDRCKHPELEIMVKFKGEYEAHYRCVACGMVVTVEEEP